MSLALQILSAGLWPQFQSAIDAPTLAESFAALTDAELSTPEFSFYTSVASVFSSKIEGEEIDLDSYVKHKRFGIAFQPDYTRKIDDLYAACQFAQGAALNQKNLNHAHRLLSGNLLPAHQQGTIRKQNMYVIADDGRIEYVAAMPEEVPEEMQKLYADIDVLLAATLSSPEAFFYASLLHLVFVKIHPFSDGNGRTARLLEKWFLASVLGEKAWFLQSEKHYYQNHQSYYDNLRALGLEYPTLDYERALPFLRMLPDSVK